MLPKKQVSDIIQPETKSLSPAFNNIMKKNCSNLIDDNKSIESNLPTINNVMNSYNNIEPINLGKMSLNNIHFSTDINLEKKFSTNKNNILYENILSLLDFLLSRSTSNDSNFYLQKIYDFINLIVTEIKKQNSQFINNESNFLDVKKDIEIINNYQKYISILTEKITYLENEILFLKNEETIKNNEKRKIKSLNRKINDQAKKYKMNELKYLLCIGDQNQKMNKLEKEANMKSIEKMNKSELSKVICFPRVIKFNENMTINPKITPLHLINKLSKSYKETKDAKKILKMEDKPKIYCMTDGSMHTRQYINTEKLTNKGIVNEKISKGKQITKNLSCFDSKFTKNKNYLISHPKLEFPYFIYNDGNFITRTKNDQYKKFTMNLFRLKFNSTLRRNPNVIIPSSLGETEVNIEKLRVFTNFNRLEYVFNEKNKIKNKEKKKTNEDK